MSDFVVYHVDSTPEWVGVDRSGRVLWSRMGLPPARFEPDDRGFLVVHSNDGVEAYTPTGSPRWWYSPPGSWAPKVAASDGGGGAFVLQDDTLDAEVFRVDASGAGREGLLTGGSYLESAVPLDARLVDGVLLVLHSDFNGTGGLSAFDADTLAELWVESLPGFGDDWWQRGWLRSTPDGVMVAYDGDNGADPTVVLARLRFGLGDARNAPGVVWRLEMDTMEGLSGLAVGERAVAVACNQSAAEAVRAFDIETGSPLWTWGDSMSATVFGMAEHAGTLAVTGLLPSGSGYEMGVMMLDLASGAVTAPYIEMPGYTESIVSLPVEQEAVVCPGPPPERLAWCCPLPVAPSGAIAYPWPMEVEDDIVPM